MRLHRLPRWLTVGAMLALPMLAHAQEATLNGAVSDTTGGALPGVTVRAVHEASGNSFEAVTDERGDYRIPARVGTYQVTAELAGFAPVTRTLTLLVGQRAVVNLQMGVSGVQESVTVTGEAPLLDVTQSSLGGNISPRQMEELPVQGRNWMALVMLAPGSRTNSVTNAPSEFGDSNARSGGDFELNVDGQQVTNNLASGTKAQPRFSRDAIAEFEFLSNRFDATQGRSYGMQVNVVTKSGTNTSSGSFSGYFRDDRFNAADPVAKRVIPYQNQQLSGTFGGPLRKDKVHIFGYYEYEREPITRIFTTQYPHFNVDLSANHTESKPGARVDAQFTPRTRLSVRGSLWTSSLPSAGSSRTTPMDAGATRQASNSVFTTLTQVLSNRVVNEVKVGYASSLFRSTKEVKNPLGRFGINGLRILIPGLDVGGSRQFGGRKGQGADVYSLRDDFTYSFTKGGRHTMKLGAEYLHQLMWDYSCTACDGELDALRGPIPANIPIESLFPNPRSYEGWNLAPLSPTTNRLRQAFGPTGSTIPRYSSGVWVQDDWTVSPRMTLNLGVRYDLELNAFANDVKMLPFLTGDRPDDTNNVSPRVGFTFSANDRTVMRGGYGLYFGTVVNAHFAKQYERVVFLSTENDGRPDFASNPYNGPPPTYESLVANLCDIAFVPGCVRRDVPTGGPVYGPDKSMPYAHQVSLGLQRQVGDAMAIEVDYVHSSVRSLPRDLPMNITYNPATGANYPFSDISKRAFPQWGFVNLGVDNEQPSNLHSLQTALTKRLSGGWQASGTYTLSVLRDGDPQPVQWNAASGRFETVPFAVQRDLGGEYGLSAGDQRHRAVLNGIWELPYDFQVSGLYFFGSGERYPTRYGRDLRQIGAIRPGTMRLRPDGSIVPRNDFVGEAIHRVDLRLQRRFRLVGRAGIDGILEVYNLFNHANFGSYSGLVGPGASASGGEFARNYKQPEQSTNPAFLPRVMQLGFRFSF